MGKDENKMQLHAGSLGEREREKITGICFYKSRMGSMELSLANTTHNNPPLSYILWPVTERLKGRGTEGIKGLEEGERSRVRNRCLEIRKKFKIREGEKKSGRKRQRERTRATDPHSKKQKCRQKRKVMHTQHGGRYLM